MTTVGLLTIGQSPRDDVTPDIAGYFPEDVEIMEVGVLDEYDSPDAVEAELGPVDGQPIFVTRMRDGSAVTIDRERAHQRLQEVIAVIEADVDLIGLLCTGHFPEIESAVPVLKPSELLQAWVEAVVGPTDVIGLIVPKAEQAEQVQEKYSIEGELMTVSGSPYEGLTAVQSAAESLGTAPDFIVMDCIGYTPAMKEHVQKTTGASVFLARSVLAKTATELF
jgi:protein AroM